MKQKPWRYVLMKADLRSMTASVTPAGRKALELAKGKPKGDVRWIDHTK